MTVVTAPPGYGKSTIVAQWLCEADYTSAWLSLDTLDNDLATLVTYLVAAVAQAYPGRDSRLQRMLATPNDPPPLVLADTMIEDLAELPGRLVLALDDYHLLTQSDIHAFMERLVQYLPSNVHLVLISRTRPALPLSRMRGRGELNELSISALQFNTQETQLLLSRFIGEPVETTVAAELGERTEGWAIGLQLAALARHPGEATRELAGRLSYEGHGYAADYLVDELLTHQTPEMREFLLRTSVLDRFCDSLIREAVGTELGTRLPTLEELERANLFVVPLDREQVWFRYHHVFLELLRHRLREAVSEDEIRRMHQRACLWYRDQGLVDEAVSHALAANDPDAAASIVEANVHQALNREAWRSLARWIDLLPESCRERPALLVARGWILNLQFRMRAMRNTVLFAEEQLARDAAPHDLVERQQLLSSIRLMKAVAAYWDGDSETGAALLRDTRAQMSLDRQYASSMFDFYSAATQHSLGDSEGALVRLEKALDQPTCASDIYRTRLLLGMASIYVDRCELPASQRMSHALDRIGHRANLPVSKSWAAFIQGLAAYEMNDLALAEQSWRRVVSAPFEANGRAAWESFVGLALTLQALDRPVESLDMLRQMHEFLVEVNATALLSFVDVMHARLATARNEAVPLPPLTEHLTLEAMRADLRISFLVSPLITRVRCLLSVGSTENLRQAGEILDISERAAKGLNDHRRLAEIWALGACLAVRQNDTPTALDLLSRSLELSERGRLVRTYLDCGSDFVPLLETLVKQRQQASYLQMLLRTLRGAMPSTSSERSTFGDNTLMHLRATLTNREMDVLILLELRLSNQEIADRLYVEPGTVKKHLQKIYSKLGVDNRRAATALAQQVGLLS